MSLALEVREAPLRIVDLRGRESKGALFLHSVGEHSSRPETIGQRLNDPGTHFVPVRRDGGVDLVHLAWIAYVAAAGRPPEVAERDAVGALRAAVELELAEVGELSGELVYSLPPGSSRVSDLLNAPGERFLMLLTVDETIFVNRDAVVRARTR